MTPIRAAAVAGTFYPAAAPELQMQLDAMLQSAPTALPSQPKALIVPHAGYIYSGTVAARAYAPLAAWREKISRVVLLGPTHRVAIRGLAIPSAAAFATPFGDIPLDTPALATLRELAQVVVSDAAHALEHSLEVHLPFLQRVLNRFALVPIAVGDASPEEVGQVLDRLWGGEETLIVVSSDLSHYLPYDQARAVDDRTARQVLGLDSRLNHQQACGATPVNGLLKVAAARGLRPQLLDLRNSGDTAGDRNRVVGYASFAFYPQPAAAEADSADAEPAVDGRLLISIARAAISGQFGLHFSVRKTEPWLHRPAASFVTLKSRGELRGCIGSLAAHRNLVDDVQANAHAAAFQDPRFRPLGFEELNVVRVEVSVLSALEPMSFHTQDDALAQIRPGIDGLVLEFGRQRGTFLPQVWEDLPHPATFLAQLKRKAGLPADFWDPGVRLARYTVAKWAEPESRP